MILGNPIIIPRTGGGGLPWTKADITTFTGSGTVGDTILLTNPLSVRPDFCFAWKDGDIGGISENAKAFVEFLVVFSTHSNEAIAASGMAWGSYPSSSSDPAGGNLTRAYDGQTKVLSLTLPANRCFALGATYKCLWIKI